MLFDDLLRSGVHLPRSSVVPQPFPHPEHVLFRRLGQGSDGWKAIQKPLVIGNHRGHLSLLEHNLTDPRLVESRRWAPWHLPRMHIKPT